MELSVEQNTKKLYPIMEKNGYDTNPREITNLYPSGQYKIKKNTSENSNLSE